MPRRRKPERLRILHGGQPRESSVGTVPAARPRPPRWMPLEAKKLWSRVIAGVVEAGHPTWIQRLDLAALAHYCMAWSTWQAAARDVAERGPLVPGRSSADQVDARLVKNPNVQIMRDSGVAFRAWARELGFTPASRGQVDLGPIEIPDELEGLLTGAEVIPLPEERR